MIFNFRFNPTRIGTMFVNTVDSSNYRGRIDSYVYETHNVTSTCRGNIVWQTRQQRMKHDLVQKSCHYEDYDSGWRDRKDKAKGYDDRRISTYDGNRCARFDDLRGKLNANTKRRSDINMMCKRSV